MVGWHNLCSPVGHQPEIENLLFFTLISPYLINDENDVLKSTIAFGAQNHGQSDVEMKGNMSNISCFTSRKN